MGLSDNVHFLIAALPGPEVVTGSTSLKAGTATKLVLNMLSTGTMIRTGKTYIWCGFLQSETRPALTFDPMVDMVASNLQLEQRSRNMLRRLSAKSSSMTDSLLSTSKRSVKLAILPSW